MNTITYENYQETKSHTEPDFHLNVYPCSIPVDFDEVPIHWHEEFEIISVKKGQGIVSVNLHPAIVKGGDIVLILPGQLHSIYRYQSKTIEYENIIFHMDFLSCDQNDLCSREYLLPLIRGEYALPEVITEKYSYCHALNLCIRKLDQLQGQQPQAWQLAVRACLQDFFYILFTNNDKANTIVSENKSYNTLKKVLKYVEQNYSSPISIETIAELTNYSPSYFMRFFKNNMGISFTAYLIDYRLTMATRYLTATEYNVLEISAKCGFESISYFNRKFRAKYGLTPTEYRKKHTIDTSSPS